MGDQQNIVEQIETILEKLTFLTTPFGVLLFGTVLLLMMFLAHFLAELTLKAI